MKKVRLLIIVDTLALLGLIIVFGSGIIMTEFFEVGAKTFMGLTRGDWYELHSVSSWFFGAMVLTHLILHFGWIKAIPKLWKN